MSTRMDPDIEKERLYALDLSGADWLRAPGDASRGPVEVASLGGGAVAMRNPAAPHGPVLRFTAHEWEAFKLGALHGEFD
ncbi:MULTISPECIES: DUF397 domain-containing protein [unclassified Streptomyces]|uniref:DUF397 domain-containing protein n=1 Tax=unclassified Streptomyces TaxID=2593676 RepID=UPI000DC3588C|nr:MULTISPECIES: DUF397 domain-containing protein [unclassified Streptomyces]RAJ71933.1 uncharacterized protein DUF397 [Streptomyces sp. PsTaAH-137]